MPGSCTFPNFYAFSFTYPISLFLCFFGDRLFVCFFAGLFAINKERTLLSHKEKTCKTVDAIPTIFLVR